jgi:hypothetical protein
MDSTNWKIGEANINILVIGIVNEGLAFPILLQMMPKFGNSNYAERFAIKKSTMNFLGLKLLII